MNAIRIGLLGLATFFSTLLHAQTADELAAKHVAAVGGSANWKKITSVKQEAEMTVQGSIPVNVTITVLHGKGVRTDIAAMGMKGYQIMTPTAGWNFMPFTGQTKAEPVTEDDVKQGADQLDAQGSLLDYAAKGKTLTLIGKEDIEGVEAYKLQLTHKSGKVETLFLDPSTYYIIRTITKQKANGQEMDIVTNLSNYQKLPEGVVVPMSVSTPMGEMVVKKVEINKSVDEGIFKPTN